MDATLLHKQSVDGDVFPSHPWMSSISCGKKTNKHTSRFTCNLFNININVLFLIQTDEGH